VGHGPQARAQAGFRESMPHETPGSYRTALNQFLRDRPRALA
jgi:hypothetical protein